MDVLREKEIIEESKSNRNSFAPIYREYVGDVYRFAYSLVSNQYEAEEITSETFLRALSKLDKYIFCGKSIKSWLFKIAHNITYDRYRSKKELSLPEDVAEYPEITKETSTDIKLQDDIKELLNKLPEITREIITLRIWEEYKYVEIADIVDKSEDIVKQQFYRGIDKLKSLLEEKGYNKDYVIFPIIFGSISKVGDIKEFIPAKSFIEMTSKGLLETNILFKFNLINSMNTLPKQVQMLVGMGAVAVIAASMGVIYNVSTESAKVENRAVVTEIPTQSVSNTTSAPSTASATPTSTVTASHVSPSDYANKEKLAENDNYIVWFVNNTGNDNQRKGNLLIEVKNQEDAVLFEDNVEVSGTAEIAGDFASRYIVVTSGTYTTRTGYVLDLSSKDIVNDICRAGGLYYYNNNIYFENCDRVANRPWGSGEAGSIERINLVSHASAILYKSDDVQQYSVEKLENGKLFIKRTYVNSVSDWTDNSKFLTEQISTQL